MEKTTSYSFTFTIPSFKKVYFNTKRRAYGSLSQKQQFVLFEDIMMKIINPLKYQFIDWVYEKHDDGRLHLHGYAILQKEDEGEVFILRDAFYTYNQKIGIRMTSYLKISDIQETYINISFWKDYINKHQDEIVFKNGYTQQKELTENLDNGIVKNIDTYEYQYDNNKYRFKGKLIVDF